MFNIWILGLTSLLTDISTEMVYPLLPLFLTTQLGASPAIIGIIEGIAESLASLLKIWSGYLSDRYRRPKKLTIRGYSLSSFGKIFLFMATSWWWVLAGRIVDRFGKGIRTAPRDSLIADAATANNRGRAFGLHRTLDTVGAVTGVLLAYFFLTGYQGEFRTVFLWSLVPAFLGVAMLLLVKESHPAPQDQPRVMPLLRWSLLDNRLKKFLAITLLFTLGNSSNLFLLLRAKTAGFSASDVILLYLVFNVIYAVFSYPAGHISDRVGRRTILVAGYLLYGIVYLGFARVSQPAYFWVLFGVYGLYTALTEGVAKALLVDLARSEVKASVIGLHAALTGIGLFPASFVAGLLWNLYGFQAPFYFGAITGLVAAAGLFFILRPGPPVGDHHNARSN